MSITVSSLAIYSRFIDDHRDVATIFHQPWWLDTVCGIGQWDVLFHYENQELVDVIPYHVDSVWGLQILRPPSFTPYLDNLYERYTEALLCQLVRKYDSVTIPLSFQKDSIDAAWIPRITHTIDLTQHQDAILSAYSTMRRRNVKKGQRLYQVVPTHELCEHFVQWHTRSFSLKGKKYPYPEAIIPRIVHAAIERKSAYSYIATLAERVVGQIVIFHDSHTAYYLLGAYDYEHTSSVAMSLLMHTAILHAQSLGLSLFDFEGSMDAGIAQFFKAFGGQERRYYVYDHASAWLWSWKKKYIG